VNDFKRGRNPSRRDYSPGKEARLTTVDSKSRITKAINKRGKIMARFIGVHTMPMTEEQAMAMTKNMPPLPKGFTWKYTYSDFQDGKFFCDWQAPNKETLEQLFKTMKIPYDGIYPVRLYNVAKKKFED
jgi:hypothetical protein